jgi:ABC-type multidrug transport system fused ATPase/permease subunit
VYVLTLISIQIPISVCLGCLCTLLPRRPDVFRNGKPVDQQYTTSFLSRATFTWAEALLNFAARNKGLSIDDLSEVDHFTRARDLRERFEKQIKTSRRVWKTIVMAHLPALIVQSILVTLSCFLTFAPQVALLGILKTLEARAQGSWEPARAWGWVIGLGAAMLLEATIEGWVFWIVCSKLSIPIQEQLASVVFAKAMRRKDVRSAQKQEDDDHPEDSSDLGFGAAIGNAGVDDDENQNLQKTRQSTLNLVAIDAKRVASFAAFNYVAYATVLELAIAFFFLSQLIGWRSLLAGVLVSALITPANVYMSRKYTSAQTDQMKFRDKKMALVTEALQGIRQIKFSALEKQWEGKIRAMRTMELDKQWSVFLYDVGLVTIWILNPLLLSAVSLAVYAWINQSLSASVAFTAMAVFMSIEVTLSILPELIADFLEAVVSANRIEKFLTAPEKIATTIPSNSISFQDATVAWPADDNEDLENRFSLQNLNLDFPKKAFSVISGKTGSGKSLLLASILGECDVLEGAVKVPEAPSLDERFDDNATRGNWIIDSAIAFVAQVPWVENASIKDNILFDLPYDRDRYQKVLSACSLEKDLDMLPDGELTEIGANGINLSGGQRWRISFARALYSRAGILVMDDLFSALDAHTGRHLYEHAITGELCQGRTRILVTHHVSLALPRADYLVSLEDGSVDMAGFVDDLRPRISDLLSREHEVEEAAEEAIIEDVELPEDGECLQKILSNRSRRKSSIANGNSDTIKRGPPKKFVEDENREIGAIDLAVYAEYIKKCGGPAFISFIFLSYIVFQALVLGRVSLYHETLKDGQC